MKNLNILDNILFSQMRDHRRNFKLLTTKANALINQVGIAHLAQRILFMQDGKIVGKLSLSAQAENDAAARTELVLAEMKQLGI